jgi:two-component system phosphate regulon sensor histidine kinase PhoR
MTARFAWLSMLVAGATALAVVLVALVFLPTSTWASFVPLAAIVGGTGVLAAAIGAAWAGQGFARALRRIVRAVEAAEIGEQSLRQFAGEAPSEVAALLYSLHGVHVRLQRTLRQVERDRGQMATVFQNMADGLLVLDGDERIALSNPAAERLLRGATPSGRQLAEVVGDAELIELARAAREGHAVVRLIELRSSPAAPRQWVQVAVARLSDPDRTLVLLQDVTDLRRAETARRDFVANVSHELRTPVAALKALVESLEAGALNDPEAGPDFLHRMHVEVDGLAQLVNELLDLARAEAGKLEMDLAPCRADELLYEAVERTRSYAERAGLRVHLAKGLNSELTVIADARRIGQVLTNLLANAVKFSPPGGRVEAGARASDGWVEFWVADTGVGIPPDQLVRVFERFYKTEPSRTGGGTGLGLAICKHLVQVHGGSIWAESAGEGRGATFRFTLRRSGGLTSGPTEDPAEGTATAVGSRPTAPEREGVRSSRNSRWKFVRLLLMGVIWRLVRLTELTHAVYPNRPVM